MTLSAEDWKFIVSVAALLAAGISLYFTKVNWLQSNRPIVTAFVTEHHAGKMAATFKLIIANTGSRPAVRVRMLAAHADIRKLLEPNATQKHFEMIESNFLSSSEIPLLRNGEELTTSFGAFTAKGGSEPWLRYGSETEICITYQDLEGRTFASKQPLKIYARDGFGGGMWSEPQA